jgi:hypothetical protein
LTAQPVRNPAKTWPAADRFPNIERDVDAVSEVRMAEDIRDRPLAGMPDSDLSCRALPVNDCYASRMNAYTAAPFGSTRKGDDGPAMLHASPCIKLGYKPKLTPQRIADSRRLIGDGRRH